MEDKKKKKKGKRKEMSMLRSPAFPSALENRLADWYRQRMNIPR